MNTSSEAAMDNDVAEHFKQLREEMHATYATKVELMAFREEVAIQFGKVHVEIAQVHVRVAELEVRLVKWFIATVIANASVTFAMVRFLH
jgi:hypothetical protein